MMKSGLLELLQYFGVTCFLLSPVYGGWEHTCTPADKLAPRGTCGRPLIELLSVVCMFYGGYNSPDLYKRNAPKHDASQTSKSPFLTSPELERSFKDVLVSKREALSFLVRKKSQYDDQSVTCECCTHQCALSELAQYCLASRGSGFQVSDFYKKRSTDNVAKTIPSKSDNDVNNINSHISKTTKRQMP